MRPESMDSIRPSMTAETKRLDDDGLEEHSANLYVLCIPQHVERYRTQSMIEVSSITVVMSVTSTR